MKKQYLIALAALVVAACSDTATSPIAPNAGPDLAVGEQRGEHGDGVATSIVHAFDMQGKPASRSRSGANMTSHGGTILVASKTMAIFWGTEWSSPSFAGDKFTGMDSFFAGYDASGYAAASTEYTGTNGQVTSSVTYLGHVIDGVAAPAAAPSVAAAVAEVCKVTSNNPDPAGVYFLFTSTHAGAVNYCAWHSYGTCSNGKPVQVAYMPNIDGEAGCDPADTYGTGHSQGLTAVANVTAHELSETITDPRNGGWYDAQGAENGDKCAWAFAHVVTLKNGSNWKLQMEWSNKAYTASSGYPNRSGQKGCLQG